MDRCYTFTDDQAEIDDCLKEAKEAYMSQIEECEIIECVDGAHADHEGMF